METKNVFDLQAMVDTHERPFVIIDRSFSIVAVNRAYEEAYGMPREQMLGRHCFEISHHNAKPCFEVGEECPLKEVYDTARACSCTHMHYDTQGRVRRVRIKAYPLRDSDGELFLGEAIQELTPSEVSDPQQLGMVGESPQFLHMLEQLHLAAASDAPVLLQGETGTGKDLAANFIHQNSSRRGKPFLTLDCTVLTESLFEAHVFGQERGAFTGSVGAKEGLFELVDGGTLFLDEIGEMPVMLQAKLLRVLETGEYRRVGGGRTLHSNARIICATNRDLDAGVGAGAFREDLYYRVACLHIRVPSLRDRLQDIPLLARALLERISEATQVNYCLDAEAVEALNAYDYPGNVRELRNLLSIAATRARSATLHGADIVAVIEGMRARRLADSQAQTADWPAQRADDAHAGDAGVPRLKDIESAHIARVLRQCNGNRRKAAAALGVSERTMYRKLKSYGLR